MEDKFKPGDQVILLVGSDKELTILSTKRIVPQETWLMIQLAIQKEGFEITPEIIERYKYGYLCEINSKNRAKIWVPEITLKKIEDSGERKFWSEIDQYYSRIKEQFPITGEQNGNQKKEGDGSTGCEAA